MTFHILTLTFSIMKGLIFTCVLLAAASALRDYFPKQWKKYREGDRYFDFPGEDGKVHKVDSWDPIDKNAISNYTCYPVNNEYWLYTRLNRKNKQMLIMGNKTSVRKSNFDSKKITIFTSHGWFGDGYTEMNLLLTKVFLANADVNVIVLDWSGLAKRNYITAKISVAPVGKMYGKFIFWLHKNFGFSFDKVHLVGHSLGGHVVGNAGKQLKGRAKRITGLDPAGPLFCLDCINRINKDDARYVEIIHTNAFMAGYPKPCGHADHYPNGGSFMPGCSLFDLPCHHARSWRYMAASIEYNKFLAKRCKSIFGVYFNRCTGAAGKMGNTDVNKKQSGLYRVNTWANYPFMKEHSRDAVPPFVKDKNWLSQLPGIINDF